MVRRFDTLLHTLVAIAVVLGAFRVAVHAATECKALKENLLTSDGCPDGCELCVLYSPSQRIPCPTDKENMTCQTASDFVVPGTTGPPCDVTYLCQDNRGDWLVTIYTDTVTAVQSTGFKYPTKASGVIWKGDGTLDLPDEVFDTPDRVEALAFRSYNLRTQLERVTLNPSLTMLYLIYANLDEVPLSLAKLSLNTLSLSHNRLSTFPAYPSFAVLEDLDLSYNAFTNIPDAIYEMPKLASLDMSSCNLQNILLNTTQYDILANIKELKIGSSVSKCPDGYERKTGSTASVCVEVATTPPVTTVPITTKPNKTVSTAMSSGPRSWIIGSLGIASVLAIAM